jgi:hypothetical protein
MRIRFSLGELGQLTVQEYTPLTGGRGQGFVCFFFFSSLFSRAFPKNAPSFCSQDGDMQAEGTAMCRVHSWLNRIN